MKVPHERAKRAQQRTQQRTRQRAQRPTRQKRHLLGDEGYAQRRLSVAPLFAYCAEHGIAPLWAARRAAMRVGGEKMDKLRLSRIKLGQTPLPSWFIEGMCREIGQPVEVVMGREWAQQRLSFNSEAHGQRAS